MPMTKGARRQSQRSVEVVGRVTAYMREHPDVKLVDAISAISPSLNLNQAEQDFVFNFLRRKSKQTS